MNNGKVTTQSTVFVWSIYQRKYKDRLLTFEPIGTIELDTKQRQKAFTLIKDKYNMKGLHIELTGKKLTTYSMDRKDINKYLIDNGTKSEEYIELGGYFNG